jgi:hypothetical protein
MIYLKLAGLALLAMAMFYLGGLREKSKYEALEAKNASSLAQQVEAQEAAQAAKEAAYEKEIAGLQQSALTEFPTTAVRLCPSARVPGPAKAGPVVPPSPGVGTANAQPVSQSSGQDIGPELYGLADALDSIVAQCRAL